MKCTPSKQLNEERGKIFQEQEGVYLFHDFFLIMAFVR